MVPVKFRVPRAGADDEDLKSKVKEYNEMLTEEDRAYRVKQLFGKNPYDGKYREKFEDVYENILEARDLVEDAFADGFQFKDLFEIFSSVSPFIRDIYDEFYGTLKDDKEAKVFLKDLVLFIYYEIEDKLEAGKFVKWILRRAMNWYVAGKLAKYLKLAFDVVDDKVIGTLNSKQKDLVVQITDNL
jgi:hypothetical protein